MPIPAKDSHFKPKRLQISYWFKEERCNITHFRLLSQDLLLQANKHT